jgi:multidrug efflux pump subunit AcrA (membrane-fusion protein)
MTTMISELYDALKEAGASEVKARRAAEAIASYEERFADIRQDIADVRSELKQDIPQVRRRRSKDCGRTGGRLGILTWMVATNIALTLAVLLLIR